MKQKTIFAAVLLLTLVMHARPMPAGMPGREEALRAAFPGAEIQSAMVFLTDQELKQASQLAGIPVSSALVAAYKAVQNGSAIGRAYLDTHVVRTKKESLLIILHANGKVKRVETVAFLEPPEYMPNAIWYRQFDDKALSESLQIQRDIHPVTGATLTARATTEAVRRALAVDQILQRREKHQ